MFSKKEIITTYTVEQCLSCKMTSKRKFKQGDYLFNESSTCNECQAKMQIQKIFGETIEQ